MSENLQEESKNSGGIKPIKILWRIILVLFILILLLPVLIHFGPIQNFLVDKVSNRISKQTNTEVVLEKVDFSVFKGFELEGLTIADPASSDTMVHIGSFSTSLKENLSSLIDGKLHLDQIELGGLKLNIVTYKEDSISNLETFLNAIDSDNLNSNNTQGEPLHIDLNTISLGEIAIRIVDENKNEDLTINMDSGLIEMDHFNSNSILISTLLLSKPNVVIQKGLDQKDKAPEELITEIVEEENIQPFGKFIFITHLELSDGAFKLDDWNSPLSEDSSSLDTKHLDISGFHVNADSTSLSFPIDVNSNIKSLTLKEKNGFEITQLDVQSLHFSEEQLALREFLLHTGSSELSRNLEFNFNDLNDFKSFAQAIDINTDLENAKIAFKDLTYFFPELKTSPFFNLNKKRFFNLTGSVEGTIDDLYAEELDLSIDDKIRLRGSLSTIELTNSGAALVNLYVDELNTSLYGLSSIIPRFSPPKQFYKLGPISFNGDIDGFFNDFVIYGNLDSDLGTVTLDTRLDIKEGVENALYSGEIALQEFDLNGWTDNPDLGIATMSARILDGKGLTLESVRTDLSAEVERFQFKGYDYSNVVLEGELERNLFDGSFMVDDPNIDLNFDGQIDLSNNQIKSDFTADIRKIDLSAVNLSTDFSNITGTFECSISGTGTADFEGFVDIEGAMIDYKGKSFVFDSLYMTSSPVENGSRTLLVSSNLINATIAGEFDFAELGPKLSNFVYDNHPAWAKKLNINNKVPGLGNQQNFRFKINVSDTKDYLELMKVDDLRLKGLTFEGEPRLNQGELNSQISIDTFLYKEYTFESFNLGLLHNNHLSKYNLLLDKFYNQTKTYNPLELKMDIEGDVVDINITTKNVLDSIENIDLTLKIIPEDETFIFKVIDKNLQMFSENWDIHPDNEIRYGDNYLSINDFLVTDGHRKIRIEDFQNQGLNISLNKFDFLLINGIINYDKIDFAGEGDADLRIDNIFRKPKLYASAFVPEFTLNKVDYGALNISAVSDTSGLVKANVSLNRQEDDLSLKLIADYNQNTKAMSGNVSTRNMVMNTFEFIIDDGISNTDGTATIDADIFGTIDDMKLRGEARINDGKTTIDYLGIALDLGTEKIRISEKFIDLTNVSLYDKFGNRTIMVGGLQHDLFGDFRSALTMTSDRFLALDTEKEDNPLYYGTGIGEMTVNFSGPFSTTDIDVTCVTGPGTVLNIPVEDTYENFDESFIKFIDRQEILNPQIDSVEFSKRLEGVDVQMNLSITSDALVNIIFNERLNDVIKGRGYGDLRVIVSREGDFNIFGNYEVITGEYLFTAWGIVAKPFEVKRGGVITWTGDPVNANLNIETEYSGLRAPTNVFLAEYLETASPEVNQEARQRTPVDLTMKLTGTLYNPVVNFDISFPELQGELRTYADSKVRTLRENVADLNEQVAGLIMFRSFLPSNSFGDNLLTTGSLAQTSYNTLSEFISNQLSYLLSGFLQEALAENGFVSGIDFEIGFSRNAIVDDGSVDVDRLIPDEIEVHFKPRFQNDKWGFDYGTSFVNSTTQGITNYVIHDFVLEYYLTNDRRLKLRAYGKWDKDEVEFENEQKYGLGINYRKEFGSLTDFKKSLSQEIGTLNDEGNDD